MKTQCGEHTVRGHNVEYHINRWREIADTAEGPERELYLQEAEYCLRDLAARANRAIEETPRHNDTPRNSRRTRDHQRGRRQHRHKVEA